MNQEIDNQLLIDVLNGNKKSERIFVNLCYPLIWGALKRFDQLDYEDKEDLAQNIMHKEVLGEKMIGQELKNLGVILNLLLIYIEL